MYGEAGIGKTALVEAFLAAHRAEARTLLGRCDALFTPQPLGPLHDIALQTDGALLQLMQSAADRFAIFGALLHELQGGEKPTMLVFEDVHWADAATLDLLKYLGRRIRGTATLIVLTYRDDELDGSHALVVRARRSAVQRHPARAASALVGSGGRAVSPGARAARRSGSTRRPAAIPSASPSCWRARPAASR